MVATTAAAASVARRALPEAFGGCGVEDGGCGDGEGVTVSPTHVVSVEPLRSGVDGLAATVQTEPPWITWPEVSFLRVPKMQDNFPSL
jgi:hypothetical protein